MLEDALTGALIGLLLCGLAIALPIVILLILAPKDQWPWKGGY